MATPDRWNVGWDDEDIIFEQELLSKRNQVDSCKTFDYLYTDADKPSSMLVQLKGLWECNMLTDVIVMVDDEEFQCHRVILAAASPYFRAVFQHNEDARTKAQLTVEGISAKGFAAILQFMYTAQLQITIDNVIDVFEAADFLQFRKVAEICSTMLLQHINVSNCVMLEQVAESHLCRALAEMSRDFAVRHFSEVYRTSHFLKLSAQTLLSYASSPQLLVTQEHDVLDAILQWVAWDLAERRPHLDTMLSCLYWDEIVKDSLLSFTDRYPFLESSAFAQQFIQNADEKNVVMATNENNRTSLTCVPSSKRSSEILVVVPRETTMKEGQKRKDVLYYHQSSARWKVLTQVPFEERYLYSVAVLYNNIYLTGGEEFDIIKEDVWQYNVEKDEWLFMQPMLKARSNHSSVSMAGKLYVVGGKAPQLYHLRREGEEYNPETCQWTLLPGVLGVEGIGRCALVPLDDKLYVVGGTESYTNRHTGEVGRRQYESAQYYDLKTKCWHFLEQLTDHIQENKISVGVGDCLAFRGFVLIIDEDTRGKTTKLYNPVSKKMFPFVRTLGQHRFSGYAIKDGTLYCTGGVEDRFRAHDLVHYRGLEDDRGWKMMTPLPKVYSHHSCVTLYKVLEPCAEVSVQAPSSRGNGVFSGQTQGITTCVQHTQAMSCVQLQDT